MPEVTIKDLNITLGIGSAAKPILHDVNLAVRSGESFGLVGESGSGKSTILRCIAGLLSQWTGEIRIDGRPVRDIRTKEFCRLVQMVFQDPYGSLHPRQSVQTTLLEPIRIHRLDHGSHLLLQTRTRPLDGTLRTAFCCPFMTLGGEYGPVALPWGLSCPAQP